MQQLNFSPVTLGHGEYVVFYELPNGEKKELSRDTFEKVYKIFNQFSLAAIMNRGSGKEAEEYANRYEQIKKNVKEIDPTLEVAFVPRTLYELIFIRECISEDLKHNDICPQLDRGEHKKNLAFFQNKNDKYLEFLSEQAVERAARNCWHICYFEDAGDDDHATVRDVAYRLNEVVVKTLLPKSSGFTHQEIFERTEKELEFLKTYHDQTMKSDYQGPSNYNRPGPTTNFGFESTKGSIKPMGIRDNTDAQIIRNAIALECDKIAQNSVILYRGGDFQKDSASCISEDVPYSLSYGTGLFAGCIFDGGATAFHYMRKEQNAYAIAVPVDQINGSPFFVPLTNSVSQFYGFGEIFHARTRAWKDFDMDEIKGIQGLAGSDRLEHLKSNLTQEELNIQFGNYKSKAIQLK